MAQNNLNVSVTAGLDKPKSVAQINNDILKIEGQLRKLKLQAKLDGKASAEIQQQIAALNRQKRQLYVDLKIRKNDLKRQYKQAISQVQTQPLNVAVSTANAQKQMAGFSGTIRATKNETETLGGALQAALKNTGLVISSQTALQLVRKAAQEATEAVKEYDKYATNLSIITNGTRADSDNIIADLSEKSFEFKVDISELENAYETLLRTGKAAGELDDYLKSTVFLSKIGFEDMETSASNLVTIGNAFKLQSDEIENVVSSLVALDTASNTVAGKLSTAMGKTAQNAQLAGLSIDQLGAIISGLRDTTGKTEDAIATSLNSMLTRLYNVKLGKYEIELDDGSIENISESLNNVERILKTVGMDIRTSKGEFRDVTEIIDELVTKWDKLNDVQKNAIGFTFAGTHHKNTFIALIENWDRIRELTEISADSTGQASEKYNAYLDSIEAKSAALSTAMKDLWNNLIPNSLVGDVTEATTGLVQFVDEYQVLQTALKSAAFYALARGVIAAKNSFLGMVTDVRNVSYAMNMASKVSTLSAQDFTRLQMVTRNLSDSQLKLVLSTKELTYTDKLNIIQTDNVTEAEARQKLATLGITQANNSAAVSTFSLSGAFKALWATIAANPIGALTIAFTGLVTIYQTVQRKQEEARQEIKDTADKAKELTDNINSLYQAYSDMQTGVENGTESKENLTIATNDLLKALGYEGEAVNDLIKKYGTLSDAINQATADTLINSLPDLANAVDAEFEELKNEAIGNDQALHFGFDLKADSPESRELLDFIKEYDNKNGGVNFEIVNSLTTRIEFEGSRDSAAGIKERLENMQSLRQALFDKYGAENVQSLEIYDDLSSRITELETAYNEYNTALSNYNDTAAQAQIIQSLIGKDIPKTADEYKAYRQELIRTAQNSGQFIGSQKDIINAIDGTISKMNEFADIKERVNNLGTAYAMFGIDDNVNSASEGIKKAFIDSLSDEELSVLIQLDRDIFDKGVEGVRQAIGDFNSNPDNNIVSEADTSSLDELQKEYENISKSADSFIKNQKSVKSALEEQEKYGQLSANSIRELSQAGYSEALVTDTVTGAVTLNMKAYEKLNKQKQEKIRLDLINEKNSLTDKLKDEQTVVSDLRQEYEALAKADMEANAGRLSEITLELAKRGANIEEISALISQINGDISSLNAPSFDNGNANTNTDPNKDAFDKLYSKWQHDLEMNRVTQEEYINWLDGAYKQYFSDLTKYQDEYNKYEAEVYKARNEREQDLFEKKIENLNKEKDKALENNNFDTAKKSVNSAITEIQNRINELSLKKGFEDEISDLKSDLEDLSDTLKDISEKEYNFNISLIDDNIDDLDRQYEKTLDPQYLDDIERLYADKKTATQNRINELISQGYSIESEEIRKLYNDLEDIDDKIDDIFERKIDAEKKYINKLKDDYSDMIDSRIDEYKKLSETIEDTYDKQIKAIDKQIEALDKKNEQEERQNDILEKQKSVREAQLALEKASIKNRYVYVGGGYEARADEEAVAKAEEDLQKAKDDLQKAYQEDVKSKLEEQKELLETQKSDSKDYYDKIISDLETQKSAREKQYDILVNIYDEISGGKTQATSNDSLIEKLNSGGNISNAVQGLSQNEIKQALASGILTVDNDGKYSVNYSTLEANKPKENLQKAEKKNPKIIPISEIDPSQIKDKKTLELMNILKAPIAAPVSLNAAGTVPLRTDTDDIMNVSYSNSPTVNFTVNVDGNVDDKTIQVMRNEIESALISYTNQMTAETKNAFFKKAYS